MSAPDYEACIRLLREKGWEGGQNDWEEMLSRERQKTWKLMEELLGDTSVFDVFLYANDYSNLKAAVKGAATAQSWRMYILSRGRCRGRHPDGAQGKPL